MNLPQANSSTLRPATLEAYGRALRHTGNRHHLTITPGDRQVLRQNADRLNDAPPVPPGKTFARF